MCSIGDVAGQGECFAADTFDFGDSFSTALGPAGGESYFSSFASHGYGGRSSDAAAASGDQCDSIFQFHIDLVFSVAVDGKTRLEYHWKLVD